MMVRFTEIEVREKEEARFEVPMSPLGVARNGSPGHHRWSRPLSLSLQGAEGTRVRFRIFCPVR